jgi:hypothetical protein
MRPITGSCPGQLSAGDWARTSDWDHTSDCRHTSDWRHTFSWTWPHKDARARLTAIAARQPPGRAPSASRGLPPRRRRARLRRSPARVDLADRIGVTSQVNLHRTPHHLERLVHAGVDVRRRKHLRGTTRLHCAVLRETLRRPPVFRHAHRPAEASAPFALATHEGVCARRRWLPSGTSRPSNCWTWPAMIVG